MTLQGSLDARGLPRVPLTLRGPYGVVTVEAVVDTGFTGPVSVPIEFARRLGLLRNTVRPLMTADGRIRVAQVYFIDVDWLGARVTVDAFESNAPDVTIGAGILRGSELVIDYGAARSVEIR